MSGSDYTLTPNLGLYMPNYDMDDGNWGFHLNGNASVLDSAVGALQSTTTGGPFLPLTGGTVSGPLTVQRLNISSIPPAQPDGSPPAGSVHGDIYNNGGFLCIAP
jgi:hypothetical protein